MWNSLINTTDSLNFLFDLGITPEDFIEKLFPSGWQPLVIQLLSFLVLAIGAIYLFYKPVRKLLDDRQTYVETNIQEAENANKTANARLENLDQEIEEKRKEAQALIDDARILATSEQERIVLEARIEAERILKEAKEDIELSKEKARQEIKDEILDVALEASRVILGREVNGSDHQRLVEEFIKDVDK